VSQIGPLMCIGHQILNLKMQDGGRVPSWKIKKGHISAMTWPICTKFGMAMHIDPPSGMAVKISNF